MQAVRPAAVPAAGAFQVDSPDIPPKGDLETAEAYGKRVAEITLQFVRGRSTYDDAANLTTVFRSARPAPPRQLLPAAFASDN